MLLYFFKQTVILQQTATVCIYQDTIDLFSKSSIQKFDYLRVQSTFSSGNLQNVQSSVFNFEKRLQPGRKFFNVNMVSFLRTKIANRARKIALNKYGYDIKEMLNILNKKSGVQGISGVSSDFRDLEKAKSEGNQRAALALDVFHYSVKKLIGSYAAVMGGVDAVIFTAGVGENGAGDRKAIVSGLEFMGIKIDDEKNGKRGEEIDISAQDATVRTLVIPTNEELMIALDTAELAK